MPTDLKRRFSPSFTGRPQQLSALDFQLWLAYRLTLPPDTIALYFDVGLGDGRPAPPGTDPATQQQWRVITQKRADVLVELPDRWLLVELRETAQPNAIGRLLTYRTLWLDDPPDQRPLNLQLVTNSPDPDVERLAAAHDIAYIIIEPPGAPPTQPRL